MLENCFSKDIKQERILNNNRQSRTKVQYGRATVTSLNLQIIKQVFLWYYMSYSTDCVTVRSSIINFFISGTLYNFEGVTPDFLSIIPPFKSPLAWNACYFVHHDKEILVQVLPLTYTFFTFSALLFLFLPKGTCRFGRRQRRSRRKKKWKKIRSPLNKPLSLKPTQHNTTPSRESHPTQKQVLFVYSFPLSSNYCLAICIDHRSL